MTCGLDWRSGRLPATLGEDARAVAEPLDGPVQQRLAGLARAAGLVLCAGSFPERDGERLFNTAVVYGPGGELLLAHRKACLRLGRWSAARSTSSRLPRRHPVHVHDPLHRPGG